MPGQDPASQLRDAGISGADISNDMEATQGDELEGENDVTAGAETSPVGGGAEAEPTA
jgi:hypothetical protein